MNGEEIRLLTASSRKASRLSVAGIMVYFFRAERSSRKTNFGNMYPRRNRNEPCSTFPAGLK